MKKILIIFLFISFFFSKNCFTQEEGLFEDARDGKIYKTVKIGEQIWLAQNFSFDVTGSWCYFDKIEYCNKFGRLYTWEALKDACPAGWHLPSAEEWEALITNLGGYKTAGYKIISGGASNFDALMSGARGTDGKFNNLYDNGMFWTSTNIQDSANIYSINLNKFTIVKENRLKTEALSVRFVKNSGDEETTGESILPQVIDHFIPEMEATAKHKAESVHYMSAIQYCTSEKHNFIYQTEDYCEIEKIFNVYMKGSLLGVKKYKVEISVIASFEKKGSNIWKPTVKNVKVISDTKVK